MAQFVVRFVLGVCLLAAIATPGSAQDERQNEAGQFDFYVLSLSWSPSFCAAAAERAAGRGRRRWQCGARPIRSSCTGCGRNTRRAFRNSARCRRRGSTTPSVSSMLDLMPAPHLIFSEWDRHGTCSGLSPTRLFRDRAQGARRGENPARISGPARAAQRHPGRGGRCLHQSQSRSFAGRHCGWLRQQAADRGPASASPRSCNSAPARRSSQRSCQRDQVLMPPLRGTATDARWGLRLTRLSALMAGGHDRRLSPIQKTCC